MRTQRTTKGNRDAGSSCSCDRGLHRYLRNFGGGLNTPNPPRYATAQKSPHKMPIQFSASRSDTPYCRKQISNPVYPVRHKPPLLIVHCGFLRVRPTDGTNWGLVARSYQRPVSLNVLQSRSTSRCFDIVSSSSRMIWRHLIRCVRKIAKTEY